MAKRSTAGTHSKRKHRELEGPGMANVGPIELMVVVANNAFC